MMNAPTFSLEPSEQSERDQLKAQILETKRSLEAQTASKGAEKSTPKAVTIPATGEEAQPGNKVYYCQEFLSIVHENTTPLIGKEGDALLIRGECLMVPGTGGVGKTLLLNALVFHLATGETFLKWQVQRPLKVLVYQAELPAAYYQKRLKPLFDVYQLADQQKAELISNNLFIAEMYRPFDISGEIGGFDSIIPDIERLKIDVLIIDPFLSFFRGNENDNNEVRRALDRQALPSVEKGET